MKEKTLAPRWEVTKAGTQAKGTARYSRSSFAT